MLSSPYNSRNICMSTIYLTIKMLIMDSSFSGHHSFICHYLIFTSPSGCYFNGITQRSVCKLLALANVRIGPLVTPGVVS